MRGASLLITILLFSPVAVAGTSNSLLDLSADGTLLACSNRDSGTVTIVHLDSHKKRFEVAVGDKPEGVSFVGQSHRLAVAVYGDDRIVFVDADRGTVEEELTVFDEPYGIVSDSNGTRLFVTLDYPGEVLEVDPQQPEVVATHSVAPFVRGIALSPDETRLYVTEYYTSRVKAVDVESGQVVDEWSGTSTDNLARQLIVHPHRPKAYLPHIRSRVSEAHGSGSIFPYVSIVDTPAGEGRRRKRIPMDSFFGNLVTANPWEVAMTPDGRWLYVVFAGTDEMFACEVIDDDYRELSPGRRVRLGSNPRAVRVAPDGQTLYVYNALDFNVVALSTANLSPIATIRITENPLSEQILTGKKLFYSALQPMASRRWISCSSCHPDGQPDGRTWQNPEGLRNTQSLAGMAWTHPIHWSADRDEVQDFEHTIRGPLMQGRGLISGRVEDSLAEPNRGKSATADALAAYANSHKFALSPHAKDGLSAAAQRGREIFFSEKTHCARCHDAPLYTDSTPRAADQIIRHDVGTGKDDPSEKMGPAFDTPTLLGVYRTAPYLHHGKAETLRDVLTSANVDDRHGKTSHLSEAQLDDLVEFLKALPYEDPLPDAQAANLQPVVN